MKYSLFIVSIIFKVKSEAERSVYEMDGGTR